MREPGWALLSMVALAFVVTFAILILSKFYQATTAAYQSIADRFGGRVTPYTIFQYPSVYFQHQGLAAWVDVDTWGKVDPRFITWFHMDWAGSPIDLQIYPLQTFERVRRVAGMVPGISTHSPEFDRQFAVHTNDAMAARELMSVRVQQKIGRLHYWGMNRGVYIAIGDRELAIGKPGFIRTRRGLEEFVNAAMEIAELLAPADQGIDFIQGLSGDQQNEVTCQICGEAIGDHRVYCRKCRTPHHYDCWLYFGACSTYGCGETRFVEARKN